MGNDIEIRVRVANQTNAGLTAVNNSLRRLRDEAQDAGRGLDGLTARATAATVALRALKDSAQDASRALRSLNTASRNADTRMGAMSDRSRTLRRDTDELDGSMRRLTTTMGALRGSNGSINLTSSSNSMDGLRKAALLLSPALIPIAASAAPIAANLSAASVAVGAFGLAIAGQVSAMNDASDAQKKYDDAVRKHSPASKEAAQAERLYLDQVHDMAPATRQAAAALTVLKDQYQAWSKSLAGDTMPVFTKGLAVAGALLPKLTPAVKGASAELDRFMTILAGGVNSGGFSKFMESFSSFATGALSRANDALVRFMRTMSGGAGSSQFTEFMAYVKEVGPQVGETLANVGRALAHLVAAASDTGVSLLNIVNAFAKLVNAVPTGALSNLLQFVVVFKAVKVAALALGGAGGALSGFGAQLAAMSAASTAAGGGLSGLAAGFGALSRATKVALIGSGIGILVVALSELSEMGKKAPADVDKLTTSLREFATGGTVSGEAARSFGKDLSGLADSLQKIKDPKGLDKVQQSIVSFFGTDSTPVKEAKENLDALDKSLANLVKGGQADLAASALENITAQMKKQGFSSKDITSKLDDYKAALADQAFEQKLAAQSMGLFGDQAQAVQGKLDAQKASADGLRQSIQALNDVNRQGLGGMIGFESAIDAAAKAAKDNAGALSMNHGVLDLNTEKARNAASALQDLADKTDSAAASARESGSSWETVNGIYTRGRDKLIQYGQQMGLNAEQAAQLADQILKIPNKTATIKMNKEDAQAGLEAFNAAVRKTPGSKSVTLKTLSKGAESVLEAFGFKVKHLPNGSVVVTTKAGGALSTIASVNGAIANLDGKTATTYVKTVYTKTAAGRIHEPYARGGRVRGYADGGDVQAFPDGGYVQGPGSGTSDSIVTLLGSGNVVRTSNTEFIVNARETARHRRLLELINSGQLPKFAKGGAVGSAARGAKDEIRAATAGANEVRLLKLMDAISSGHIKMANALKQVGTELSRTKDKIKELRDAASQLKDSVRSNILSGGNITKAATAEDSRVTINTILSQMTGSAANAREFDSALKRLQKRGLSSALLQQIAEAGVEGGGLETAQALLGGSASQIKTLNSLQGQLAASANSAGATAATAVYGAQIKAQEKLVKALDRLSDALKKVGKKAGGGPAAGLTVVGEEGPELVSLPSGSRVWSNQDSQRMAAASWTSMLNSPRHTPGPAAGPGGGWGRPLVIQLQVGDKQLGEVIIDPLRRAVHHRGGNVQAVLGKG